MNETTPEQLINSKRAVVVAPAGCGKTELIVNAVSLGSSGKQLVLTHTNAGVDSLNQRFKRIGVSSSKYKVQTIASFALEYSAAFPKTSSFVLRDESLIWNEIYIGAIEVLKSNFGKKIISASYKGVFVDEYQDCTEIQHLLVQNLANNLPCRVLGDPLQGIFEFEPLVDWGKSVFSFFESLPNLTSPWRWIKTNPQLGYWLLDIRKILETDQKLQLNSLPKGVKRFNSTPDNQRMSCYAFLREQGSVVAINKWKHQAHQLARGLGGSYISMEEVEANDLIQTCSLLEKSIGVERVLKFLDFTEKCLTKISTELSTIKGKLKKNDLSIGRISKNREIASALFGLNEQGGYQGFYAVMTILEQVPGARIFRPELWSDMKNVFRIFNGTESLMEVAKRYRQHQRFSKKKLWSKVSTRVLLIKGLEYDNSIILDADKLTTKELYVALTRAKSSMIIHSESSNINLNK
ncbi:UvrD-helicase domain-containing protein [Paenibacillus sp. 32352]|uniref:UvrD-helicase domain-containing protein n=1 Tax=Paenibacillus sp. 32352 TaxID=1969111 RepID=UPI0009ADF742|nr:UvrD-helicase domain-containing protein [Paenibacillus sp. 32352]